MSDAPSDEADGLQQLQSQLSELRQRFQQTDAQIASYLNERREQSAGGDSTAPAADGRLYDMLKRLWQRVSRIDARLERRQTEMQRTQNELTAAVNRLIEDLRPSRNEPNETGDLQDEAPASPAGPSLETFFGADLARDADLAADLEEIRSRLSNGDAAALSLAGHLMIFRSAAPERRPPLLKDVGEAYYLCRRKTGDGSDRLETALAAWLQKSCEQAGFLNSIEIVHPGELFDSTRHTAVGKGGAEVAEVLGWVVLRDNGKVYTKASVATR